MFPQCSFSLKFSEILSQILIRYRWLSVSKNSKIMDCGILINKPHFFQFLWSHHRVDYINIKHYLELRSVTYDSVQSIKLHERAKLIYLTLANTLELDWPISLFLPNIGGTRHQLTVTRPHDVSVYFAWTDWLISTLVLQSSRVFSVLLCKKTFPGKKWMQSNWHYAIHIL